MNDEDEDDRGDKTAFLSERDSPINRERNAPSEGPSLGDEDETEDVGPNKDGRDEIREDQEIGSVSGEEPAAGADERSEDDKLTPEVDWGGCDVPGEQGGLFDDLLQGAAIFERKEVLRPSYTPRELPHREEQINDMATILVSALRGDTPSNILVYGKTGTGKTASAQYVSDELEKSSGNYDVPCNVEYINCEVTDTQYRVLAQLANKFIDDNVRRAATEREALTKVLNPDRSRTIEDSTYETVREVESRIETLEKYVDSSERVPMTGWPTDRVYTEFFDAVDFYQRVVVIMLDEIDKLVEKSGDDTLYNLSRMNSDLDTSRVSIIGISNDLKFTDFLDPRVKSSLGEEEIVFPPYNAEHLKDILEQRAEIAFQEDILSKEVIPLCAAFAAQEHGDARRALDLLRTAGELAERSQSDVVEDSHVRSAQEKIELDRIVEAIRTLPTQSKLILLSIITLEEDGLKNINTGEVFNVYKQICGEIDADVLTQRRVTDLISELDMLGIVNAIVVSKGRYGRSKEISLSVPADETKSVLTSDARLAEYDE